MNTLSQLSDQDILLFLAGLILAVLAMFAMRRLLHISFPYFFMGILGLVIGVWVGSHLAVPFAALPVPYNRWVPMLVNVVTAVAILDLFLAQARPIGHFFSSLFDVLVRWLDRVAPSSPRTEIILDTSILVDGRIEAIGRTGFLMARIVVPHFVIQEMQMLADQGDQQKRIRGRRGLEVLSGLQKIASLDLELTDELIDVSEAVDNRLVALAAKRPAKLLTTDFNLQQVAQIRGVEVLNINELAASLKPVLLPGERISTQIVQKGKERGQGIGYLPDGTMIVVEGGSKMIGELVECEVVRIFQSAAGTMIFGEVVTSTKKSNDARRAA